MRKWLPIFIFVIFGYYLVGANFQARLGMIDDHEVPLFLETDGKIGLMEVPKILAETELGRWGEYQRFRPAYYTLRVIETALWQENAALWYGMRYLMLVGSLYLLYLIIARFFPKLIAYGLVFYVMTFSFWSDLLARLGPSEIYTVPALLLFTYGMITSKLWLIAIGYALAVGSKENFLFLFPLLVLYAGNEVYRKRINVKIIAIFLLLTIYTLWIAAAIYLATKNTGTDVYGATVSYGERLMTIYRYKRYIVESKHLQIPILAIGLGIVLGARQAANQGVKRLLKSKAVRLLFLAIIVMGVIGSQYLFYNANFPTNMRYDFPVVLLFPLLQIVGALLLIEILPKRFKKPATIVLNLSLLAVATYFIASRGYGLIRQATQRNATATAIFAGKIDLVARKLEANSEIPLVFAAQNYYDYEPLVSVARYLNARSINNTFMLQYKPAQTTTDPELLELDRRMKMVTRGEADPDRVFDRFSHTILPKENCYSISFSEAKGPDQCEQLTDF